MGERYFLLFNVTTLTGVPQSYIMFEVSQYDSYSYLFTKPMFISLDPNAKPGSIQIEGIRIGVNGTEAHTGQAYANVQPTVTDANYTATCGPAAVGRGHGDRPAEGAGLRPVLPDVRPHRHAHLCPHPGHWRDPAAG